MQRSEVDRQSTKVNPVGHRNYAGHVRFRAESELGKGALERCWEAAYSVGDVWARFRIVVDLGRNTCTLSRTPDTDYGPLLRELAGKTKQSLTPLPTPPQRVDSLTLDVQIIGLKMSQVSAAAVPAGPAGDWLVAQAFLPGSTESFLLGVSNRLSAGEIVIPKPESAPAVLHVLSQIFG